MKCLDARGSWAVARSAEDASTDSPRKVLVAGAILICYAEVDEDGRLSMHVINQTIFVKRVADGEEGEGKERGKSQMKISKL